jgi:alginate O-acetyltransferase complex protein AlgI
VITLGEAWIGALAYTFQLYFDFSGYSDMAIGLSWMLNIRLPFNFNSPYKARNISDFWRRWHMTLSAFLRDYLYIALGGNRRGKLRRYLNLFLTMLLGGLWHGASWTFVFWGGLHGLYLMINHAWQALRRDAQPSQHAALRVAGSVAGWTITFLAVVVGWVFFRAPTFEAAANLLQAMVAGEATLEPARNAVLWNAGIHGGITTAILAVLLASVLLLANSNHIGERLRQLMIARPALRFASIGSCLVLVLLLIVVNEYRSSVSAFIYFNF